MRHRLEWRPRISLIKPIGMDRRRTERGSGAGGVSFQFGVGEKARQHRVFAGRIQIQPFDQADETWPRQWLGFGAAGKADHLQGNFAGCTAKTEAGRGGPIFFDEVEIGDFEAAEARHALLWL